MNLYIGIGNLTKTPDLRTSQSGTAVCRFTIAINEGYGEKATTTYMNIVTFNKTAENCEKYLSKGSKVAVKGRIQNGSYVDKDGLTRYTTDVIASEVEFLSSKAQAEETNTEMDIEDVDLPF